MKKKENGKSLNLIKYWSFEHFYKISFDLLSSEQLMMMTTWQNSTRYIEVERNYWSLHNIVMNLFCWIGIYDSRTVLITKSIWTGQHCIDIMMMNRYANFETIPSSDYIIYQFLFLHHTLPYNITTHRNNAANVRNKLQCSN